MGFRQYRPGPALRDHVEYLWTFELDGAPDHAHERVLPTGTVELCISTLAGQEVARMLELSRRRFIEVFTEDVGMTPKRFAMVRRFQRALALASRAVAPAWSRIAAECGYYDQPHLCRDWLDITGFSPEEHMRQRAIPVNPNHVAIR